MCSEGLAGRWTATILSIAAVKTNWTIARAMAPVLVGCSTSSGLWMAVVLIVASYLSILYFDGSRNLQPVQSVEFPLVASARVLD